MVSLGHQLASGADMARLCDAGARMLTHLGNALPPLIPRHENPLFAGLANDQLTAAIITDGFHLPPPVRMMEGKHAHFLSHFLILSQRKAERKSEQQQRNRKLF